MEKGQVSGPFPCRLAPPPRFCDLFTLRALPLDPTVHLLDHDKIKQTADLLLLFL